MQSLDPKAKPSIGPTPSSERLYALDAARGWALLGIFLVNVLLMGWPIGELMEAGSAADTGWAGPIAYHATAAVAIGRSFPLFSLLFGVGLAVQLERSASAFRKRQVRRLILLAAIGICHALLLWFGDILFVYACSGLLVTLVFLRRSTRALWCAGSILYGLGLLLMAAMTLLESAESPTPGDVEATTSIGSRPAHALYEQLASGKVSDPTDPFWLAAETKSFQHGPFEQALLMRGLLWIISLVSYFLLSGSVFAVVALFLIGAALHRVGAFTDPHSPWPRRMVVVGLPALLLSLLVQGAIAAVGDGPEAPWLAILQSAIGPLVSAGYLGAVLLCFRRPPSHPRIRAGLCAVGQMALTNYIAQSLVGAVIFQHWGVAQFGQWSLAAGSLLAIVVWSLQMEASRWWLARFRFGPLEWLWRSATYGNIQPMRKATR